VIVVSAILESVSKHSSTWSIWTPKSLFYLELPAVLSQIRLQKQQSIGTLFRYHIFKSQYQNFLLSLVAALDVIARQIVMPRHAWKTPHITVPRQNFKIPLITFLALIWGVCMQNFSSLAWGGEVRQSWWTTHRLWWWRMTLLLFTYGCGKNII